MDFVLGILTGITLCIAYGQYLTNQARRHQREQQKQAIDFWNRLFPGHPNDLEQQLKDAITREDFDEAARLRDLINRR